MKRIILSLLLLVAIVVTFTACKDNDKEKETDNKEDNKKVVQYTDDLDIENTNVVENYEEDVPQINIGDIKNVPLEDVANMHEIGKVHNLYGVGTPLRLYYDEFTKIVYIDSVYIFTPYYAPNGLPYRYDPETNTLREIKRYTY